jgi:PleD family two-component response regulator
MSVGVATLARCSPGLEVPGPHIVLELADQALYRAKEQGRDRVVLSTAPT